MSDIVLIPFGEEHVARTFEWVSAPAFQRIFLIRQPPTRDGHREYFRKVMADSRQRVFAILAGGRHVGNGGFKNVDAAAHLAELWIYIGDPAERGRGIGITATRELLHIGSKEMNLERIYLHVADFNTAARNMYAKLGFVPVPLTDVESEWKDRGCRVIRMEWEKTLL